MKKRGKRMKDWMEKSHRKGKRIKKRKKNRKETKKMRKEKREGGRGSSAVAVPIYCIHKKLGKKGKTSAKRDDSAVTKELDK